MKTLGRIFIILAVTALVGTALYLTVDSVRAINFSGSDSRDEGFQPENADGANEQFRPDSFRPDQEEGRERGEGGIWFTGLILGWIRHTIVISVIVAILVLPKGLAKRKRLASVKTDN